MFRASLFALLLALGPGCTTPQQGTPLTAAPRLMAEWEPARGTLIVYPFELPDALVVDLGQDAELFVLVQDEDRSDAKAELARVGLAEGDYALVPSGVSSPWTRDWGPHQVARADGRRLLVDHVFKGYPWVPADCDINDITYHWGTWEAEDDAVFDIAAELALETVELPAIATGGNLLTDGHGRAFCTQAQVVENMALIAAGEPGHIDEARYRELLSTHLGITHLVVLENTEPLGIQHIDCWLKVVDAETLLMKRAPTDHPEHDPLERNLKVLEGLKTPSGGSYRILRIDCDRFAGDAIAAYTNSLRVNDVVYVPTYGIDADVRALATYREAYPDCEVRGYLHDTWRSFDALHCRARALLADPVTAGR